MTRTRKPFPLYLVTLVMLFLAFSTWSARQAATDGARITDRDYYSKGLRYNTSEVERRAAATLGWKIKADLSGRILTLNVSDRDQQPVSRAQVQLSLLLPGQPQSLVLTEQRPGEYSGRLPGQLAGELPARYLVELDGARLERNLLINLQD